MKNRTFGLSVLTTKQVAKLLPGAKKTTRLLKLEDRLRKRGGNPVVNANVLQWHQDRKNGVAPRQFPWNEYPGGNFPETADQWLQDSTSIPFLPHTPAKN